MVSSYETTYVRVCKFEAKAKAEAEAKAAEAEAASEREEKAEAKVADAATWKANDLAEAVAKLKAKAKSEKAQAGAVAKTKAEASSKADEEAQSNDAEAGVTVAEAAIQKANAFDEVVAKATEAQVKAMTQAKDGAQTEPAAFKPWGATETAKADPQNHREAKLGDSMAYGDPHMQNVLGQRFDLMRSGSHTLVQIPRFAAENELFRVQAEVQRVGSACADMYIQTLNVTGGWVEAKHQGGLRFGAGAPVDRRGTNWMSFGTGAAHVDLKVVHGQTPAGTRYLNFFVRHLRDTGYRVGGLLGEDDHTAAATPDSHCKNLLNL
jgi:hypothetical protein